MKCCQLCGEPSTIHLTEIAQNVRREMHLCERCGREREIISDAPGPELNLPALLTLLFRELAPARPTEADFTALTCATCGLKYAQFRKAGRFGCPTDYDIFRGLLLPLLERIHRSCDHAGKAPRRHRHRAEHAELTERLAAAIAAEQYEEAARIRDALRALTQATGVHAPPA